MSLYELVSSKPKHNALVQIANQIRVQTNWDNFTPEKDTDILPNEGWDE